MQKEAAGGTGWGDLPETDAILSTLSHDLRSPLNTIIGFSEILLSTRIGKLNKEQKKQLSIILRRGNELLSLLDNLVDYCKLVRHEQKLRTTTISLNSILKATIERVKESWPVDAPLLLYSPPKKSYRILGEEQRLSLILLQLLQEGESLFHPREIHVAVEKIPREKYPSGEFSCRVRVQFVGQGMMDPQEIMSWNGTSKISGRSKFTFHLANFLIMVMGGKLSIFRKKGRIELALDFCEEEK